MNELREATHVSSTRRPLSDVIFLFLLMICGLYTTAALGQTDRGTLTGVVEDSQAAVVPSAKVIMRNVETGGIYSTETTGTGSFSIPALPAGTYNLTVEHAGFKGYAQNGISISVAQTTRQNVTMAIGSTTETVTVTADATLLKTENAEQSTTVSRNELNELPLPFALAGSVRDPLLFAKLAPGVEAGTTGNGFRVNGLPTDSFKITVDGQDSTSANLNDREDANHPGAEMVQEFTLQSSNYSAEFGQVGGGLFNFTARSGTNSLHGSMYENMANEALNANQPFTSTSNKAGGFIDRKIRQRQNDYGFTIGGPVRFPFLYDGRNKTFFFGGWEHYGQSNASVAAQTVPTDLMRQGIFTEILTGRTIGTDPLGRPIMEGAIYDPTTARVVNGKLVTDPFPNNTILPSRFDGVAARIQALVPRATLPGVLNNFSPTVINPVTNDIPAFKIDQTVTNSLKTSFYFSRMSSFAINSNDGLPIPLSSQRPSRATVDTYRLNGDYAVSPNLLVHTGAGYTRWPNADSSPVSVTSYDAKANLGLPGGLDLGFPRIGGVSSSTYGGFINGNGNGVGPTQRNLYWMDKATGVANMTYSRGNHTYKAGSEYKNDMWIVKSSANVAGSYNFSSSETALPYNGSATFTQNGITGTIGAPYASFLLGQVDSGSIANAVINQYHRPGWGLFAQDTWKAMRNLTVDYGMRWDFTQTEHEHGYRTSGFSPTAINPNAGGLPGAMIYEGYGPGQCNCNFMPHYSYAIGPRLGVAFSPDDKTVFRGGFGVTYGQAAPFDYAGSNFAVVSVGFNSINFSSPGFGLANTTLSQGLQYSPSSITNAAHDPGYNCCSAINGAPSPYFSPNGGKPPRIMNFTVSMQRQIGRDLAVEIAYVGNRASWLISGDQGNLGLQQFNAISPQQLAKFGFNPTNHADAVLLNGTFAQFLASTDPRKAQVPLPYPTFPTSQKLAQALRPFPQYGTIYTEYSPDAKSWYDALQIKVTKRMSHGIEFLDSFTWSKELDEGTDTERGRGSQINDALNRSSNKFLTSSYRPFINIVSLTYQTPVLPFNFFRDHVVLRELTSGWTIGGILKYQNGALIRVPGSNAGSPYVGLGNILQRGTWANRVPNVPLFVKNPNCHCFNAAAAERRAFGGVYATEASDPTLNAAAWSEPAEGTFSNGAPYYNDYRWQRQPDEEMSIGKKFFIPVGHKEPATLQIRAEFFDIFNRALYPTPNSGNFEGNNAITTAPVNQGTATFGTVNVGSFGGQQYRSGQLVARFQF